LIDPRRDRPRRQWEVRLVEADVAHAQPAQTAAQRAAELAACDAPREREELGGDDRRRGGGREPQWRAPGGVSVRLLLPHEPAEQPFGTARAVDLCRIEEVHPCCASGLIRLEQVLLRKRTAVAPVEAVAPLPRPC